MKSIFWFVLAVVLSVIGCAILEVPDMSIFQRALGLAVLGFMGVCWNKFGED